MKGPFHHQQDSYNEIKQRYEASFDHNAQAKAHSTTTQLQALVGGGMTTREDFYPSENLKDGPIGKMEGLKQISRRE